MESKLLVFRKPLPVVIISPKGWNWNGCQQPTNGNWNSDFEEAALPNLNASVTRKKRLMLTLKHFPPRHVMLWGIILMNRNVMFLAKHILIFDFCHRKFFCAWQIASYIFDYSRSLGDIGSAAFGWLLLLGTIFSNEWLHPSRIFELKKENQWKVNLKMFVVIALTFQSKDYILLKSLALYCHRIL